MVKNRRNSERLKVKNGIVMTPNEVCKLTDLSPKGFSFKCVNEQLFSSEWPVDIYDTSGLGLEQLQVNKVWQQDLSYFHGSPPFMVKVGVEFKSLSHLQKKQLTSHLRRLVGCEKDICLSLQY